ncbi:hypothetical protein E3226_011645 [Legionella geestiana]|uniref:hypothetical protein n=1 Tax=Legionella geestiana TaxID=45065 RepID=UPI001091FE0F|nr:hypothetical protein [Legionella geestiana]QDQ41010.1 hypothetical protein E3226_011645 [Legionella geestiana]
MSDLKSKLPDFQELTSMTMKLFGDVKKSVCEIVDDYKQKRAEEAKASGVAEEKTTEIHEDASKEKPVKKTSTRKKADKDEGAEV